MTGTKCFAAFVSTLLFVAAGSLPAQMSSVLTVEEPSGAVLPSAGGILNPHLTTGRFGTQMTGGYLSPTPNQGRLADNGMIFSPSGSFIGMNTSTRSSRFGQYWEQSAPSPMPTESNLDLLENRMLQNQAAAANSTVTPTPQQVSATRPAPFPSRQEEPRSGVVEAFTETSPFEPQTTPFRQPEQVWMRGSAGRGTATGSNGFQPSALPNAQLPNTQLPNASAATQGTAAPEVDGGSRFIGGGIPNAASGIANAAVPISFAQRQMNPNQEIQENLELMLMRAPTVNPLSPIQVLFQGGKATVRGVVPADINRIEAGRILLTHPQVTTVDNRLTVLPTDPTAPLPKPFDPNQSNPNAANPSASSPNNAANPAAPNAQTPNNAANSAVGPTTPASSAQPPAAAPSSNESNSL